MGLSCVRVIVADDHLPMRDYLSRLLQRQPGVAVVSQCSGGDAALQALRDAGPVPDVVLLDVALPLRRAVLATRHLRVAYPQVSVLACSIHNEMAFAAMLLESGAAGYVLKDDPLPEIVEAIRAAAACRRHVSRRLGAD